jgi:hypothetical protein
MTHEHLHAFESIDRLSTVELRPGNLPRGHVPHLYAAARGDGEPLAYRIAFALSALEQARVAIFTGVVIPPFLPLAEIDGPIGSIVLARALTLLGHDVDLVVESCEVEAMTQLTALAGVDGIAVVDGDGYAAGSAADVAIAVEKISASASGVRHSVLGTRIDALDPATDGYFTDLLARGALTIGIGDAGNEIGFGALQEDVERILGEAATCRCGCATGIVAATATSFALPAAISNLGAYGLAAALALVHERQELCASTDLVATLIEAASDAGFLDGGTLDPDFHGDDGVPLETIVAFVHILDAIVAQALRDVAARPF